ncbi:MAG: protein phosphatase 2C domain-containing protein [Pirellulaceae bacterium]|nr:protein phosphatase 2C domain-containing protein [Pirellulaceae bacterium]
MSGDFEDEIPRLESFGASAIGKVRAANQDHFLIASLQKQIATSHSSFTNEADIEFLTEQGRLLIVADGMGGHATGELAAKLAIQSFANYVLSRMHWHLHSKESHQDNVLNAFVEALEFCQSQLLRYAEIHPESAGMGTTLTVAYIAWPQLFVLHAGDSRCYVQSGNELRQLTTDHTVTQQLLDSGEITVEQAINSPFSHCVWNAIGGNATPVSPQLVSTELKAGQTILLCSDGLTKHLSDAEILLALQSNQSAEQVSTQLLDAAIEAGGRDNVTVVVSRIGKTLLEEFNEQSAADQSENGTIVNDTDVRLQS